MRRVNLALFLLNVLTEWEVPDLADTLGVYTDWPRAFFVKALMILGWL